MRDVARFVDAVHGRTARVGIVGLGYVGLPLALTFARRGFRTIGFDVDKTKTDRLSLGESYIHHIPGTAVAAEVKAGRFHPTTDFSLVTDCDAVLLCVPTPLTRNREPNMEFVEGTAREIAPFLRPGHLVVLESTTYPGTTDDLLRSLLETHSGLTVGEDFFLAYSPEREDPGNDRFTTETVPKVVGGVTPACLEAATALYSAVVNRVVPVSSTGTAEMTKLLENIFRSVNIALVNELKIVSQRMGIDIWEVISAASTKPFGFMPFFPGPGLGGHCIPIDPFYLTWKAREYDLSTRFIELAGEINTMMPHYVVDRTAEALNDRQRTMNGSNVLVLGVAYKRDVDDLRESPALRIVELLQVRGARVGYHDPYVKTLPRMRKHDLGLTSVPLTPEVVGNADAVIVATDHRCIDYAWLAENAQLIVDTRNVMSGIGPTRATIVKA